MTVTTQQLSIGELDSLVFKAFRGAGFSWGLAQEAGRAAAWLAIRDLPSASAFAELLRHTDGKKQSSLAPEIKAEQGHEVWLQAATPVCPVMTGTAISDFGWNHRDIRPGLVYTPLILVPFVAACARSANVALCVTADDTQFHFSNGGELASEIRDCEVVQSACVGVTKSDHVQSDFRAVDVRRATVTVPDRCYLESLAHRTYVPASDESRSGAGAGLTDND